MAALTSFSSSAHCHLTTLSVIWWTRSVRSSTFSFSFKTSDMFRKPYTVVMSWLFFNRFKTFVTSRNPGNHIKIVEYTRSKVFQSQKPHLLNQLNRFSTLLSDSDMLENLQNTTITVRYRSLVEFSAKFQLYRSHLLYANEAMFALGCSFIRF